MKLADMPLEDLYGRKPTASVEAIIISKDDFSKPNTNWCEKICRLKCKNVPLPQALCPTESVDILIIQDYKALDDTRFNKSGDKIEAKLQDIIRFIASKAVEAAGLGEGVKKPTFAVANLLRCKITREDVKKGKPPTDTVLSKCKPYLLQEIKARKPKLIISLSTIVTKSIGLKKSNYNDRGDICRLADGTPVIITLHPRILTMLRQNSSGKFWGPDFYSVILRDFVKAIKVVQGELSVPDLDAAIERVKSRIHIARSIEDVKRFSSLLLEVGQRKVLSYDTETTSLDPYWEGAKLITAQFGFRNDSTGLIEAYVFPLWHRENKWYDATEAWKYIAPILESDDIKKIGHNFKFDILYTYMTTGVRIKGVLFDTLLLLHQINSGLQGMYGLKKAVVDWIPESELGGYEDKLPKLTKKKKVVVDEEDGEEREMTEEEEASSGH